MAAGAVAPHARSWSCDQPDDEVTQQALELPGLEVADTSDDWYTPRWIFDAAGIVFDMDVCAPVDPARRTCPARRYLTAIDDGLTVPWEGVVWMNPPFSETRPWVDRWIEQADGMALLPAANGTRGFSSLGRVIARADRKSVV